MSQDIKFFSYAERRWQRVWLGWEKTKADKAKKYILSYFLSVLIHVTEGFCF